LKGRVDIKERIIKAAIEEIHEKGVKFSVDDLAKRLGISKRTMYQYFPSKMEILDTIIDQIFNEMNEKAMKIIEDDQLSLLEKIKSVITVLPDHYEIISLTILDQLKRYYPEQHAKMSSYLEDDWELLRVLIEQGMREGVIVNMNLSLVMKVVIDTMNSTLDTKFYRENNITISEALAGIVDILLFGLVAKNKR
jgi:AcrR family transcriptional regulator